MANPTAVNDHLYVSAEQYYASVNLFENDGELAGSQIRTFNGEAFDESATGSFYIREEDNSDANWEVYANGNFSFDSYLDYNLDYEAPREIVDVTFTYTSWDGQDENLISNEAEVTIHIAYWAEDRIMSDAAVVYGDLGYFPEEAGPGVASVEPMLVPGPIPTNDVIVGTSDEGQELYGLDGDDFIIGGEGDDTIVGGDDRIDLSDGDEVDGGEGIDTGFGLTWDDFATFVPTYTNLEFLEVSGTTEFSYTNQQSAYAEGVFTGEGDLVTLNEYFESDAYLYKFGDASALLKTTHEVWDDEVLQSSTITDNGDTEVWATWHEEYFSNGTVKTLQIVYDDGSSVEQNYYSNGTLYQVTNTEVDGDEVSTYLLDGETAFYTSWTDTSDSEGWSNRTQYFDAQGNVTDEATEWDNGAYVYKHYENGVMREKNTTDGGDNKYWGMEFKTFDANGDLQQVSHFGDGENLLDESYFDTMDEYAWQWMGTIYDGNGGVESKTILWDGGMVVEDFYDSGALATRVSTDLEGEKHWYTKVQTFGPEELLMETELFRTNGSLKQETVYDPLDQFNFEFKTTKYTNGGDIKAQEFLFDSGVHIYVDFEDGVKSESVAYDEGDQFEWATRIRTFDTDGDLIEETFIPDDVIIA